MSGVKPAMAFGCRTEEDIRLHFSAAVRYLPNPHTGRPGTRVDNTLGTAVELMVSDIRSYRYAMYYMCRFNDPASMVLFWDEPTITLDAPSHELHDIIRQNWTENVIPKVVLSSATLPQPHEIVDTVASFMARFPDATVETINSYDCRKTIPLFGPTGQLIMPHTLSNGDWKEMQRIVQVCESQLVLLRYIDVGEASRVIMAAEELKIVPEMADLALHFPEMASVSMESVKRHYLLLLRYLDPKHWPTLYNYLAATPSFGPGPIRLVASPLQKRASVDILAANPAPYRFPENRSFDGTSANVCGPRESNYGMYLMTHDAHTLTDGPTIYITNDITKMARYCIQQANVPTSVMTQLSENIQYNNKVSTHIDEIQSRLDLLGGTVADSGKDEQQAERAAERAAERGKSVQGTKQSQIRQLYEQMNTLVATIRSPKMPEVLVPNTHIHLEQWAPGVSGGKPFASQVTDEMVVQILQLIHVDHSWKLLLLLGIGVLAKGSTTAYTDLMKQLADNQQLFLIIADGDYIHGTNYQYCHGYVGKDASLTQDKIIQSIGRVGRNHIQQTYSIRFRDMDHVHKLFSIISAEERPEAVAMNRLMS